MDLWLSRLRCSSPLSVISNDIPEIPLLDSKTTKDNCLGSVSMPRLYGTQHLSVKPNSIYLVNSSLPHQPSKGGQGRMKGTLTSSHEPAAP